MCVNARGTTSIHRILTLYNGIVVVVAAAAAAAVAAVWTGMSVVWTAETAPRDGRGGGRGWSGSCDDDDASSMAGTAAAAAPAASAGG